MPIKIRLSQYFQSVRSERQSPGCAEEVYPENFIVVNVIWDVVNVIWDVYFEYKDKCQRKKLKAYNNQPTTIAFVEESVQ